MKVARLYRFRASHSLPGVAGYDHPHEHDYTVEVVVGPGALKDGMVVDTQRLDDVFDPLCEELTGADIDETLNLGAPSTVENLANHFLLRCPPCAPLHTQVTVWEDDDRWGQSE